MTLTETRRNETDGFLHAQLTTDAGHDAGYDVEVHLSSTRAAVYIKPDFYGWHLPDIRYTDTEPRTGERIRKWSIDITVCEENTRPENLTPEYIDRLAAGYRSAWALVRALTEYIATEERRLKQREQTE